MLQHTSPSFTMLIDVNQSMIRSVCCPECRETSANRSPDSVQLEWTSSNDFLGFFQIGNRETRFPVAFNHLRSISSC